jgi:hypothetical protein
MRLHPHEIEVIRAAARQVFGGDIDLLVEVERGQATIANEQRLRDKILPAVQDLRVDIILHQRGTAFMPLERIALRDGILLTA